MQFPLCPDHFGCETTSICINSNCEKNRLLCSTCCSTTHEDCFKNRLCLEIDSIKKKDLLVNQNWISDQHNREALIEIGSRELKNNKDQILVLVTKTIEDEIKKLHKILENELESLKQDMLLKAQLKFSNRNFNAQKLNADLNKMYDITPLADLVATLKHGSRIQENFNENVKKIVKRLKEKEQENSELKKESQSFQETLQDWDMFRNNRKESETERKVSEMLAQFFPANDSIEQALNERIEPQKDSKKWNWDEKKKSNQISLYYEWAYKEEGKAWRDSAVLGDILMTKGHYSWKIEVPNINTRWICFGIIEEKKEDINLEIFPYEQSIGFSLQKDKVFHMRLEDQIEEFKSKTYQCDLDLDNGSFKISCDGKPVASNIKTLEKKFYIPYVVLFFPGNQVKLHMVQEKPKKINTSTK